MPQAESLRSPLSEWISGSFWVKLKRREDGPRAVFESSAFREVRNEKLYERSEGGGGGWGKGLARGEHGTDDRDGPPARRPENADKRTKGAVYFLCIVYITPALLQQIHIF